MASRRVWPGPLLVLVLILFTVTSSGLAEDGFEVRVRDGYLDLRTQAAPLRSVLEAIASQAGLELRIYGEGDPRVTVELTAVPLEAALKKLLQSNYVLLAGEGAEGSQIWALIALLPRESVTLQREPAETDAAERTSEPPSGQAPGRLRVPLPSTEAPTTQARPKAARQAPGESQAPRDLSEAVKRGAEELLITLPAQAVRPGRTAAPSAKPRVEIRDAWQLEELLQPAVIELFRGLRERQEPRE